MHSYWCSIHPPTAKPEFWRRKKNWNYYAPLPPLWYPNHQLVFKLVQLYRKLNHWVQKLRPLNELIFNLLKKHIVMAEYIFYRSPRHRRMKRRRFFLLLRIQKKYGLSCSRTALLIYWRSILLVSWWRQIIFLLFIPTPPPHKKHRQVFLTEKTTFDQDERIPYVIPFKWCRLWPFETWKKWKRPIFVS